jgi:hypothetical protein
LTVATDADKGIGTQQGFIKTAQQFILTFLLESAPIRDGQDADDESLLGRTRQNAHLTVATDADKGIGKRQGKRDSASRRIKGNTCIRTGDSPTAGCAVLSPTGWWTDEAALL